MLLIAGPCAIESLALCEEVAGHMKELTAEIGWRYVFKASFDKANRTSLKSPRGVGIDLGLQILAHVREKVGVKVLTDVHEFTPIEEVASAVDWLQTPAMLCRQTDFIQRVARAGRPVNIKKGQFLDPLAMRNVVEKARAAGAQDLAVTERGFCFGYNDLVVDMRSLVLLRATGCPVIFDATHSVQKPGAAGGSSGGAREFVPALARAAVAIGVDGLFMECHPEPDKAWSDGPNSMYLSEMRDLLNQLAAFEEVRTRL